MPADPLRSLTVTVYEDLYCIAKLPVDTPSQELAGFIGYDDSFVSVTHCKDETSIITRQTPSALDNLKSGTIEEDWSLMRINGQLEFELVGVIAKFAEIFAGAEIPIFCLSTFNTDYFLVKNSRLSQALQTLDTHGVHWTKENA